MKVFYRVMLFSLITGTAIAAAIMFGMPGARDGTLHLAGDYYFTHSGADQNSIVEMRDGVTRFVVPMKVEEFVVQGNGIFVARRPVMGKDAGNNRGNFELANTCEYYRIDVTERKVSGPFDLAVVRSRAEWAFLKNHRVDQDFGATMCKLAAVRE